MKKTFKRICCSLLIVIISLTSAPLQELINLSDSCIKASAADVINLSFDFCEGGIMVTGCNQAAEGELVIPSKYDDYNVVAIGDYAFSNCSKLTSVKIPEGVRKIGVSAFEGCLGLEKLNFPEGLTTISEYAFFGCDSLKSAILPKSIKDIGAFAFYDSGVENVVIPDGVTVIREGTFAVCEELKNISIPLSVKTVELFAFEDSRRPDKIFYMGSVAEWYAILWHEGNDAIYLANGDVIEFTYHVHSYLTKTRIEPTCTQKGYYMYTCECSAYYVSDYINPIGHSYKTTVISDNNCNEERIMVIFCDKCGDSRTDTIAAGEHTFTEGYSKCLNCDFDKAHDCSCNCHKLGFMGFIWKIMLFFNKLFKTNRECLCGAYHY